MLWVFLSVMLISAVIRVQAERKKRLATRAPPDDPRWTAGPRKQIAGRKCIECGVKIVTAHEGDPCDTCGEVAHVETCLTRHAHSAHHAESRAPYR
jgi:hypothetical protein